MNLCNVKLEGPFGKGDKSEQMVEKCVCAVKTHCLCREVPRKRKAERERGESKDHPPPPSSYTYSWVRHIIKYCRTE